MYNSNQNQALINAALLSALGAGIVTTFAVGQGQHPLMALFVTAIATLFGVVCHQSGLG